MNSLLLLLAVLLVPVGGMFAGIDAALSTVSPARLASGRGARIEVWPRP